MTDKLISFAMASALQAVARMKGDSTVAWPELLAEAQGDDRFPPASGDNPQQGWKPAGR